MHRKILSPKWRLFSRGRWVRSCNHLPLWIASSFFPHLQKHQLEPKHCPLSSPLTQKGPNGAKLNRPTGLLLTIIWWSNHSFHFKLGVHICCVSIEKWFTFGSRWTNFGPLVDKKWLKTFVVGGFSPLSRKLITQSTSTMVYALAGWVFRIDSFWDHLGPILAL